MPVTMIFTAVQGIPHELGDHSMTARQITFMLIAIAIASHAHAEDPKPAETQGKPGDYFRQVGHDEMRTVNPERALVMGSYVLDAKAAEQLLQVDTLMKAINRIRATNWKAEPWTKENAELTIRQRMDDYLATAHEFYSGKGKRPAGTVGRRLEKYTDTELGDRQLSSALTSVQLAAAWDVPLQTGQAERLDAVIRLRIAKMKP